MARKLINESEVLGQNKGIMAQKSEFEKQIFAKEQTVQKSKMMAKNNLTWGRHAKANTMDIIIALSIMLFTPCLTLFVFISCANDQCTLSTTTARFATAILSNNVLQWIHNAGVQFDGRVSAIYGGWLIFQLILMSTLPGKKAQGQLTPAGNLLTYHLNGLNAWIVTHFIFVLGAFAFDIFPSTYIYDNWGKLLVSANIYGFSLTLFAYIKGRFFPTHPEDCKYSGNAFYDLFMGIELNPRIGNYDFKLFNNSRIGIIAWSLINLSFAAKQYQNIGYITNSMIILNVLQAIYILDLFYNEDWYLRTIDMAHDHFGFYFCFGDAVWLPFMYTLQGLYLVKTPVDLSWSACILILVLGIFGYYIFRSANWQKDYFRRHKGNCRIWGQPAKFIIAPYTAADNSHHSSVLLYSGWWGISRHANYMGDLMMSMAFCLACSFEHILPYFYIIYMTILLVSRVYRDNERCSNKYGKIWVDYCMKVRYRIIPGIF